MGTEKDLSIKKLFEGRTFTRFYQTLHLINEYLSLMDNRTALKENNHGLVAQSGRAPGFYSTRVSSRERIEKIPDGRGFKSLRARFAREVIV